jgi:hypothetical protein
LVTWIFKIFWNDNNFQEVIHFDQSYHDVFSEASYV